MPFSLFLCLYKSFWKGFESDQRRLTLLVIKSGRSVIKLCYFPFTVAIILSIFFFMSRTTVFYKAKPKAHITYIA